MNIEKNTDNLNTPKFPNQLLRLGWDSYFQTQHDLCNNEMVPARVIGVSKNKFRTSNGKEEWLATLAGRISHDPTAEYPVTGDWVLMKDTMIVKILERKNALSRGASGAHNKQSAHPMKEQVIAANLDTVFIVSGLDQDFNLRRIERYLTLIYNCGLNPVIVLTKADLHKDPEDFVNEVETVAFGVPVHLVSASEHSGLAALTSYLESGKTTTMVGSSGAGKSTLVNRLYGKDIQATGAIGTHTGKGRHTTTTRDLIIMPQGGMVIDNPGIREIAFWDADEGIDSVFPEIERLSKGCRFSDCSHTHEPGCNVQEAVEQGELPGDRLKNYQKMKRELEFLSDRQQKSADRVEKERWKGVALKIKAMKKGKPDH